MRQLSYTLAKPFSPPARAQRTSDESDLERLRAIREDWFSKIESKRPCCVKCRTRFTADPADFPGATCTYFPDLEKRPEGGMLSMICTPCAATCSDAELMREAGRQLVLRGVCDEQPSIVLPLRRTQPDSFYLDSVPALATVMLRGAERNGVGWEQLKYGVLQTAVAEFTRNDMEDLGETNGCCVHAPEAALAEYVREMYTLLDRGLCEHMRANYQ